LNSHAVSRVQFVINDALHHDWTAEAKVFIVSERLKAFVVLMTVF